MISGNELILAKKKSVKFENDKQLPTFRAKVRIVNWIKGTLKT